MKSRLLIASAVVIAAMMLMSPFVMTGEDNIMLGDVEGGVCINELSVIDGVLCDSSGQAFDVATPILIDDEADLRKLSELGKEFTFSGYSLYLTSNIKMTDEFDPIGNYDVRFQGTFDGQGYTISNLTVNISNNDERVYAGLFGYIGPYGVVKNLGLVDSNISASLTIHEDYGLNAYAGGIAGRNRGHIENCYNTGNVITTSEVSSEISLDIGAYAYAGGIVGRNSGDGEILKCYNTGYISAESTSSTFAGGIAGRNSNNSLIIDCHNAGIIYCESSENYARAGGIAGRNYGTIEDCYNMGEINAISTSPNAYAGGIVGSGEGSIENCYNIGYVSAKSTSYAYAAGIIGRNSEGGLVTDCCNYGIISSESTGADARAGGIVGSNYGIIKTCCNTGNVTAVSILFEADSGGIAGRNYGTIETCYNTGRIISETCMDENSVAEYATANSGGIVGYNPGGSVSYCYNEGEISATNNAGSAIDDEETVYVDNYAAAGGIIGDTSTGSIDNCYNIGNVTSTANAANAFASGIAGADEINISICYNTGNINAVSILTNARAGGIAGYVQDDGCIISCYNTGNINAYSERHYAYAAGIAAGVYDSNITNCYNLGNISATASNYSIMGGIAGIVDDSNITNCYNLGNIVATEESHYPTAGGIAGWMLSSAMIEDCYNMGTIESTTKSGYASAGGIVGYAIDSTIDYCYNIGDVTTRILEGDESDSGVGAFVGGIAGIMVNESDRYVDLGRSYNAGNISAYSAGNVFVGGIAGDSESSIQTVYNIGNIYVESSGDVVSVGGIAGYSLYFLGICYNVGNITASTDAIIGSIVGISEGIVVITCYLEGTADAGIGQSTGEDSSISLASEEMKGWKLLGYESEYNLNGHLPSEYMSWLPDIFNANNGYPIISGVPIHTQSVEEAPLSAAYVLIGNETTQAENYLKPYTSKTPAVNMSIVFGDLQNLEGFGSETPTYSWYKYSEYDILSETASFTPSEFGIYKAYIKFEDENGNKYSYYLMPRIISEAIEYTISFEVPEDAEVTVKDSSGNVVSAESDGTYLLEAGEYTYTVTKEGYKTVEDKLPVTVFDAIVLVSLEKETNTIYYIIAAIVVILVVVAIAYFITKKK